MFTKRDPSALSTFWAVAITVFLAMSSERVAAENANSEVQREAISALTELENSMVGSVIWSKTLSGSKCKPNLSLGLFFLTLSYETSTTCPLIGTVKLNFYPFSADIDLDVQNTKHLEKIQMKTKVSVKYTGADGLIVALGITEGHIFLDTSKGFKYAELGLNGSTRMNFTKSNYSIQGRRNLFDVASLTGFSLINEQSKTPAVNRFEACTLAGASMADVNGGTLTNCKPIFK